MNNVTEKSFDKIFSVFNPSTNTKMSVTVDMLLKYITFEFLCSHTNNILKYTFKCIDKDTNLFNDIVLKLKQGKLSLKDLILYHKSLFEITKHSNITYKNCKNKNCFLINDDISDMDKYLYV